jgi:signal transduction histidine kinase
VNELRLKTKDTYASLIIPGSCQWHLDWWRLGRPSFINRHRGSDSPLRRSKLFGTKLHVKTLLESQIHGKWLKESLQLQMRLRRLTHQVLVAQENERTKISYKLRDEVAQNLLSINVQLLLLKQIARGKTKGLKNEIACAQRLVVESARSVRRLARELDGHRPTSCERAVTAI